MESVSSYQVFQLALGYLKENGYASSEAREILYWLFEKMLGLKKTDINPQKPIFTDDYQTLMQNALERLIYHEPIQYILEEAWFLGRSFKVGPGVLIPRPETEELVQLIIQNQAHSQPLKILDIGTGSGCIAISLKKEVSAWEVYGLDISEEAIEIARQNAQAHLAPITLIHTDILSLQGYGHPFDVIVSNPPYITEAEKVGMQKNVLEFEPHQALFVPDQNPLKFYEAITKFAKDVLSKEGSLYFEINPLYSIQLQGLLEKEGFKQIQQFKDMQGKIRMVQAKIKSP